MDLKWDVMPFGRVFFVFGRSGAFFVPAPQSFVKRPPTPQKLLSVQATNSVNSTWRFFLSAEHSDSGIVHSRCTELWSASV